jgi:hypothetical protein
MTGKYTVERKSGPKTRRVLGWTALVLGGVAIGVALLAPAMGAGHGKPTHVEQPPAPSVAPVSQSPNSRTSDLNTAANLPAQSESKPMSTNCFENDLLARKGGETSVTRGQFADDSAERLSKISNIYASAQGDSNEYLLFSTSPENIDDLRQLYADMTAKPSIRANLCMKGFFEVQFIVRDAHMNQKLVAKFQTNISEALHYLQQQYGATPIQ